MVKVALHCLYCPEDSPEMTGEDPPTAVQLGLATSFVNKVLLALTSNVILVLAGVVMSQHRASQTSPEIVVLNTWLAIVPEA